MRSKNSFRLGMLLIAVVGVIWLTSQLGPRAQHVHASPSTRQAVHVHQQDQPNKVEPIADGSKDPNSISDDVALRVLFTSLALPANPSPQESARLRTKIHRMNLSDDDTQLLIKEITDLSSRARNQNTQIAVARQVAYNQPSAATQNAVLEADQQLQVIIQDSYNRLLQVFSSEGASKLQAHLAYIKTKIKIIPPPKM